MDAVFWTESWLIHGTVSAEVPEILTLFEEGILGQMIILSLL